jgi:hypothetical protein
MKVLVEMETKGNLGLVLKEQVDTSILILATVKQANNLLHQCHHLQEVLKVEVV